MSSELYYHNIPDIKLKTVGTSIVDICAKFKTKELPVVSLIPAKLWLLPHSSFYNANFLPLSLKYIHKIMTMQLQGILCCSCVAWPCQQSHQGEGAGLSLRGHWPGFLAFWYHQECAVPGRGNL